MTHQDTIEISTKSQGQMHDITAEVKAVIQASKIRVGTAHIFNVGSTACVGTIEYESGLEADLPRELNRLLPPGLHYGHEAAWHDGNGHSHLQATMMGPDLIVPVQDGKPILGTWQQIFHLECDIKPRQRKIVVTVIGE